MSALKEGEDIVEPLADRIVGTVALESVYDPIDGEIIVERQQLINEAAADAIENAGIHSVRIRSVLTCAAKRGICQMCYGRNLATMGPVDIGEAVGIIAAQSIGEPWTQLTLRTFHIDGASTRLAAQNERKSKIAGVVALSRVTQVEDRDGNRIITSREGEIVIRTRKGQIRSRLKVPYGATIHVEDGQAIKTGHLLFSWNPYSEPIVADVRGVLRFEDIVEERTVREDLDESTGRRQMMIVDRDKKLHPRIVIEAEGGGAEVFADIVEWEADREKVEETETRSDREFIVPVGAQLTCADGDEVLPGDRIAAISRIGHRTRDITGGLPRVAELFEARKPQNRRWSPRSTGRCRSETSSAASGRSS